jgi:Flp pilus assembly protein TadG
MTTNWLIARLRDACRRFAGATDGNTVITFALAFIPLMGLTGAAVDYSRANQLKTAMQAAADTTALMIAQNAGAQTSTAVQTSTDTYYRALFNNPAAQNLAVTGTYTSTNGATVVVSATATYRTAFMGIMGFATLPLAANSTASFGNTRLRVALVLDNTGSMASAGKMTALKNALNTATTGLLDMLRSAAVNDGDVYVSIIPFVKDVNVDPSNYNASWIYWDDAAHTDNSSWDAQNGSCDIGWGYNTRSSCLSHGSCNLSGYSSQSACTAAGTCSVSGQTTQTGCNAAGTCSMSQFTSQGTCTGTCSLSAYTSPTTCTSNGTCSLSSYTSQPTCTSHGTCTISSQTTQNGCTSAHHCTNSFYTSKNPCQNAGYSWVAGVWTPGVWTWGSWTSATWTPATWTPGVWSGNWTPDNHSTWNGCVVDRGDPGAPNSGNYDTNITAPTSTNTATMYAAEQYSSCPQAVMGLNYNWTAMKSLVTNMSPNGNTNQAIGLQLGWMSLFGGGPFTMPAEDPNYTYQHVIILLTDGLNTQDRWYTSQTSIDARQAMTCANAKAAGVTLYMIQVNTDGSPTSTLLRNCASDSSKFFLLTSSNQIITTFAQIGTALSQLRIAN